MKNKTSEKKRIKSGSVENLNFCFSFEFKFPLNLVFQTRPALYFYDEFPKKLRTQNFFNRAFLIKNFFNRKFRKFIYLSFLTLMFFLLFFSLIFPYMVL